MENLKKLIYLVLGIQEKFLRYRLSKTLKPEYVAKKKQNYSNGCLLELQSLAEAEKQKFEDELVELLKKADYDPEKLLRYAEVTGTKVVFINNASYILNSIKENEGFLLPQKGLKALYLSIALFKQFKLSTDAMFVLSKGQINKYYFLYHYYNWFAFQNNIAGMNCEAQNLLKKYLFDNNDTKELHLSDIYRLKDAINQDKASIEFVIKLCRNYDGAKSALEKIKKQGAKI